MSLETIRGNLRPLYKELQPGTMQHVDQLMNQRFTYTKYRYECFCTADGGVYVLDGAGKTPSLAITREVHNPVLKNIDDAFEQLHQNHNYRPVQADVEQALAAPETVLIALPSLRLSGDEAEWGYLKIGTTPAKYDKLNDEERKLAERVYGQGDDFPKNMKMLKDAHIGGTRIYVLNPDYVREHAAEAAIARASWLDSFDDPYSYFYAVDRAFGGGSCVRGVRKKTDGDKFSAQKSDSSSDFLRRGASDSEQVPAGRDTQNDFPEIQKSLEAGRTFEYKGQLYVPVSNKAGVKTF